MEQLRTEINLRLEELLEPLKSGPVKEAMSYSLLAPGKRLRPLLFLSVLRSYQIDYHILYRYCVCNRNDSYIFM
ncbi:MAG: hypothetical protein ACLSBH_07800 [Coprobacillus cateniformis]